jgi:hypothetical protein
MKRDLVYVGFFRLISLAGGFFIRDGKRLARDFNIDAIASSMKINAIGP